MQTKIVMLALLALMASTPSAAQTLTPLHEFRGNPDGATPIAALLWTPSSSIGGGSVFYGTTYNQGNSSNCPTIGGCGTIYKITSAGVYTVLYNFTNSPDGAKPWAGLVADPNGAFYGTTEIGGLYGKGTIFKITGAGQESVLYSFTGAQDGANPRGNLVLDRDGNLYGTACGGGIGGSNTCYSSSSSSGFGTVFKLTPGGQLTTLYTFTGASDGSNPYGGLVRDASGNLYGTANSGGDSGNGTVFKISATGQFTLLHSFTGNPDGAAPWAALVSDANGNLYGTTRDGGANGHGTVFKVDSAGQYSVLYSFTGNPDGDTPYGALIFGPYGNLYGTTFFGGIYGNGTIFKITPAGQETVLYTFVGNMDGGNPLAGLTWLPSASVGGGTLWGTTYGGGGFGDGALFKLAF